VATLALGMDILEKEGVGIDSVCAHGGFYKTQFIGQNATSMATDSEIEKCSRFISAYRKGLKAQKLILESL
jgi:hypothetical protein